MMKTRIRLTASAQTATVLALFGAVVLGGWAASAQAQAIAGGAYYYGPPQPAYVAPPPAYAYPPVYYYPAPAYYYPPAPAYYYAPAPVYYPQPSYLLPGISANFVFGFGGGYGHGGHRH